MKLSREQYEELMAESPDQDAIGFWTPEAVDQRFLARIEHEMELRGELEPEPEVLVDVRTGEIFAADEINTNEEIERSALFVEYENTLDDVGDLVD